MILRIIRKVKTKKQRMFKNKHRISMAIISLLVLISVFFIHQTGSFSQNENIEPMVITDETLKDGAADYDTLNLLNGYQLISESSSLEFYSDLQNGNFIIKNKRDDSIWKSFTDEGEIQSEQKPNKKWLETMSSLVLLHYTNYSTKNTIPSSDDSVEVECNKINDTFEVSLDFTKQKISIVLRMWLKDNVLHLEIPSKSINEYGNIGIMQIDVLPFFISSHKGDEGYIVNPDGSGALYHLKENKLPYANRRYTFNVYSRPISQLGPERYEDTDVEITTDLFTRMSSSDLYSAAMPIFGMKRNEAAVLGVISKGEANSLINIEPHGYAVDANRIFPSIVYRSAYKDPRPEVAKMITYYEKKGAIYDSELKYVFLDGENADYSGMANAYRKILLEENGFVPNAGKYSGAISLFGGIEKDQVLFKSFITATTFDQAVKMLEEIGASNLIINLRGSATKGYGYYNKTYKPEKDLGGKQGLEKLIDFASHTGNSVFIEENFVDILPEAKVPFGFNNLFIRDPNNMLISDNRYEQFIINPLATYDVFRSKYLKKITAYNPAGITFSRIGELIYGDNSKRRPMDLHTCVDTWEKFMDSTKDKLGSCAVQGGNIYAAKKADWLYNIPMNASGCPINDETIPFYQMVLHGLVDYSGTPGNLSYSFTQTLLNWVEYGCVPYFELTYSGTEEIMKTFYDKLYSSSFDTWKETVKQTFNDISGYSKSIQEAYIIKHEKFDMNRVKVTYSNGVRIYVNYNESEWLVDSISVPSEDYLVAK